jgi:hypothetical protein
MLDRGVFSINHVLDLEDQNPIGKDGDKRFVQQNMQLLENAGEVPPAPPQPGAGGDVPAQDGPPAQEKPGGLRAALMPVLVEAVGRTFRREAGRLEDARKRLREQPDEKWQEWGTAFRSEHLGYAREALLPGARALAALLGLADPDTAASVAVAVWLEGYGRGLTERTGREPTEQPDPAGCAEQLARRVEAACAALEAA